MDKIYIGVIAQFSAEGDILPLEVLWEDGRRFCVDYIKEVKPAASFRAGGAGIRYRCLFNGAERYLFLEDNRWFVEKPRN